jgi:NAD-dependent dihydropyrimidine dehydrogenase PreA subunit
MVRGLEEYMMRKGVSNVTDLIGLATDRALPRERLFDIHGIAKIDESKCVPCRICVSRCPWGGAFEENGTIGIKLATKGNGDGCIGCGLCTFVCPTQAITIEYSN